MKQFTIRYPKKTQCILGRITTNRKDWGTLDFKTKVCLLGSFVKQLVEYKYDAVDSIPGTQEPLLIQAEDGIYMLTLDIVAVTNSDEFVFSLVKETYEPAELIEK